MATTYPAFTVEWAPGVASSTPPTAPDWVDITSRVDAEWSVKWGRWGDEFSESGAGTGSLRIANNDGLFDPDNSGGTYYGDLVAGTWFRIKGGTTTANTDVFYGHVDDKGFQLEASQFPDSYVRVDLVDDLEQLANTDLPSSVWSVEVETDEPEGWWRHGESSGTVAFDSSGNGRHLTYVGGATFNSRASLIYGESDSAIAYDNTVSGSQYATADFTVPLVLGDCVWEFVVEGSGAVIAPVVQAEAGGSHYFIASVDFNSGTVGVDWIDDAGNLDSSNTIGSGVSLGDGEPHVIAIKYESADGDIRILIDGVDETTTVGSRTGKTLTMGRLMFGNGIYSGVTIDDVVLFTNNPSDARLAAHATAALEPWGSELSSDRVTHILDAVAFPASLRNIDTGNSALQPADLGSGDAASALRAVAKAEGGYVYVDHQDGGKLRFVDRRERWTATASLTSQATFGDSGSEITYDAISLQDDRVINRATVQRANGAAVTIADGVSEAARRRTYSESGLLYETDAESQARAERIVAEKADRHRVPTTITLRPRKSTHSAWAHVFARKVNDRVTVKWRPSYGGTYTYTCWIDGISHKWSVRNGLETTFSLSPVPYDTTGTPYWILNTSTLETGTNVARLGY